MLKNFFNNLHVPPLFYAAPARGGAPSPSAGQECSVQPRRAGAGLVAVWVEPAGSEWVGWKPEALEQAASVALGDGGHLLALDEPALWCPRRHGYKKREKADSFCF